MLDGVQGETYGTLYDRLATDPEPEVRQAAQRTRQERRKRLWAEAYLTRVMQTMQARTHSNADVLAAWPYMEALKRVDDDTTISMVRTALGNHVLPPHLRQCYQLLLKETSEGWEKAMKHWPQAGNMWTGALTVGQGTLITPAGDTIPVQDTVWREDPLALADAASWGGMAQTASPLGLFYEKHLTLQMEDVSFILIRGAFQS